MRQNHRRKDENRYEFQPCRDIASRSTNSSHVSNKDQTQAAQIIRD